MNILAWNIGGIAINPSIRRLKKLFKSHKLSCVAIFEPKISPSYIKDIMFKLNCVDSIANNEGNIWILWKMILNVMFFIFVHNILLSNLN